MQQASHNAESPTRQSELRRVSFAVLATLAFLTTMVGISATTRAEHYSDQSSDQSDHSSDDSGDYSDHSEDYSR